MMKEQTSTENEVEAQPDMAEEGEEQEEKSTLDTIFELAAQLEELTETKVFVFLLIPTFLGRDLLEVVYEILEEDFKDAVDLDVLVTSGGGDIHTAYHLAKLFRQYAPGKLRFIVPRYAKSAATVLIFGGDEIVFGPTSEMGPLDPQIALSTSSGDQDHVERISPLAIRPTLDLIAEEHRKGHSILVEKLSSSLPDALVLGRHLKMLEVAKHYVSKLLITRMLKGNPDATTIAESIGNQLVSGYPDHSCCIDHDEARSLGLVITQAPDEQWKMIWEIWKRTQQYLQEEMEKQERDAPPVHDILS